MNSIRLPEVRDQNVTSGRGQVEIHVQACAVQNLRIQQHGESGNLRTVLWQCLSKSGTNPRVPWTTVCNNHPFALNSGF